MKNIKTFESFTNYVSESEAKEIFTKIYGKIEDEINIFGVHADFLIDLKSFLDYAHQHDGAIASNMYDTLNDAYESIKSLYNITSNIYVTPRWKDCTISEITNSNVYSDSIYIEKPKGMDIDDIDYEVDSLGYDDISTVDGISGRTYIGFWFD